MAQEASGRPDAASRSTMRLLTVVRPDMLVRWPTPAGTQTARCGGTTQCPFSVSTLAAPSEG